jgi:hypothetical protein
MRRWSDDFDAAPRDPEGDTGGDPLRILSGESGTAWSEALAMLLPSCQWRFLTSAKQPHPPAGTD